ncbi:MAG: protein TolQ [Acidobacteria bacterium]|nr:protein TolQ [Acidobacteriota bacterium]
MFDILSMLKSAGPVSQLVILILLILSIGSWKVIVQKSFQIRRAKRHSDSFLNLFRNSNKFLEVKEACREHLYSPEAGLFLAGFSELNYQLKYQNPGDPGKPKIRNLEAIARVLDRAKIVELGRFEKTLNFLATTAAAAPFVGLFGTVWGVIDAFQRIGIQKTASLVAVAPGISEALIATAAGLAVAIPALWGYNHYVNKIRTISAEIEDFTLEFLGIVERNFS